MCLGLGEFAETIASSFGIPESKVVKCPHALPLHNDEAQTENLFRVLISLSDSMPDFAMRYQRNMRTFEMERGFLAVVSDHGYVRCRQDWKKSRKGVNRARHFTSCQPMPQL
jgi:hypothetical protein